MSGARARHDAQVRAAQYDAAAVASGAITPGDVVARRRQEALKYVHTEQKGRTIEIITTAAQAAELYGAGSVAHQLLQGVTFEPLQQESQERAAAPNLQLPVTSGSSDGAEIPGAYKRAFEELQHECRRMDSELTQAKAALTDARSKFAKMQLSRDDAHRVLEGVRRGRKSATAEVDDLKASLTDARSKFAKMQLSRDRCARERDNAIEQSQFANFEALELGDRIDEAAAQFRAITGDFPGLTGPLVDLFKDVK